MPINVCVCGRIGGNARCAHCDTKQFTRLAGSPIPHAMDKRLKRRITHERISNKVGPSVARRPHKPINYRINYRRIYRRITRLMRGA